MRLQVRHDNNVTWLAFWHDPVTPSSFKYVWLAANSSFKSESDQVGVSRSCGSVPHVLERSSAAARSDH